MEEAKRNALRRFYGSGNLHFVTFSCYRAGGLPFVGFKGWALAQVGGCLPQAVIPPSPLSPVWAGPSFERPPFRSVPIFRRARSMWKPRFDAAAPGAVHRAYACDVQLAPLQLRLPHLDHLRRQAHPMDLLWRTSAAGPGGHSARGIRGRIRRQAGICEQARRSLSDFRGRLISRRDYCGYCLTLVTRVPVKRTKTVFDGGWP